MTSVDDITHFLKNCPVRELIKALERDGFYLRRCTQTGGHIYACPNDGRIVVVHYHHSNDTLKRKTLKSILDGTRWTREDLERLKLI